MGPRNVKSVENVWIPMSDGVRIAARMWLPEDAEQHPVPAIMEYIPYRKRDDRRLRDETHHPYLASYGFACIRPDTRGAGDSEGLPQDEYVKQEQDDGVEIIAWLARQNWCTGNVGMFGISWGGFSALQVAARQPPALKAIITHCSTDDRYTDDAHYEGGCINQGMFEWGIIHTLNGARPPDPEIVGDRWREIWRQRLENLDFYVADWLSHQQRDSFWKHGSVDENYAAIRCAVYAVGGWVDAYNCAIPRLLAGLKVPRKGLIGPWSHDFPNQGLPGPTIDWLTEAIRWWDHWLKGIDTGLMDEPMYRVWMQDEEATLGKHEVSGRWVAEDCWPSPRIEPRKLYLTAGGLDMQPGAEVARFVRSPQTVGISAPHWLAFEPESEAPTEQGIDDGRSLVFDSEPLPQALEILGAPVVTLDLSVDKPIAFLAVRLNEVEPTGASIRVTYAVLNLTQRDSKEFPVMLEPTRRYRVRIPLRDRAHMFKAGNRLRIAVSTTYWPLIWPSPDALTLTVYAGHSELELPVRPPRPEDSRLRPFGPPFIPQNSGASVIETAARAPRKTFEWDVATRTLRIITTDRSRGVRRKLNATGSEIYVAGRELLEIRDDDPTSARIETHLAEGYSRGDWDVRVEATLRMSLTRTDLLLRGEIKAFDGGRESFVKLWDRTIPRRFL
jgi:uncharacterized protein